MSQEKTFREGTLPTDIEFFVSINNQQNGPFDLNKIKELILNGSINKDTLVWKLGMDNWDNAVKQTELNNLFNAVPPPSYEELKPLIMIPEEKFVVSYRESSSNVFNNVQGGHLWVCNTEIFFKPHAFNLGDLSKKFMKISDIIKMEKVNLALGLSRELHITDKNGYLIELISWNRNSIISAIEKRKTNLV